GEEAVRRRRGRHRAPRAEPAARFQHPPVKGMPLGAPLEACARGDGISVLHRVERGVEPGEADPARIRAELLERLSRTGEIAALREVPRGPTALRRFGRLCDQVLRVPEPGLERPLLMSDGDQTIESRLQVARVHLQRRLELLACGLRLTALEVEQA